MIPVQIATSAKATSTPSDSGSFCARASADLAALTIARSVLRQSAGSRRPYVAKSLVTGELEGRYGARSRLQSAQDLAQSLLEPWPRLTPGLPAASVLQEQLGQSHTTGVYGLLTAQPADQGTQMPADDDVRGAVGDLDVQEGLQTGRDRPPLAGGTQPAG